MIMSKIDAITHLYMSGYISEEKAYALAKKRDIDEIDLRNAIDEAKVLLELQEQEYLEGETNEKS